MAAVGALQNRFWHWSMFDHVCKADEVVKDVVERIQSGAQRCVAGEPKECECRAHVSTCFNASEEASLA